MADQSCESCRHNIFQQRPSAAKTQQSPYLFTRVSVSPQPSGPNFCLTPVSGLTRSPVLAHTPSALSFVCTSPVCGSIRSLLLVHAPNRLSFVCTSPVSRSIRSPEFVHTPSRLSLV